MPEQSYGSMQIRATTARGAIPVEGARVYISETDVENGNTGVIASGKTNSAGLTEKFRLPTPPVENSNRPDGPLAYTRYNVQIIANGYSPLQHTGVPVFPGILSIQGAELVPELSEES